MLLGTVLLLAALSTLLLASPGAAGAAGRPSTDFVGFDVTAGKVANRHVRAGISLALTRTSLAALGHAATPGASYVPPGVAGYRTIAGPTNAYLRPLAAPDTAAARE